MFSLLDQLNLARPLPAVDPPSDVIDRAIAQRLLSHWNPSPEMSIEQWIREKLTISAGQSSTDAGKPLDLSLNPQSRVILDFLADPDARELNIMKSSAGGISTTVIAACVHRVRHDPGNILYLIGSDPEARKVSTVYWRPYLEQIFGATIIGDKKQAALHFKVNGIEIFLGSPTEDQLRNKQILILVEDESDTMEEILKGGAQDLDVAQAERTKNARGSKIIRLCCPLNRYDPQASPETAQPRTRIHRHYLRGDQREFRCPCPGCGIEHPISEHNLKTEHCRDLAGDLDLDRVAEETFWECPSCQYQIPDSVSAKTAFFNAGRHVPTTRAVSRHVWSALVTDLAVLFGKASSWGFVMSSLLQAQRDGETRYAGARRSHLAEPRALEKDGSSRTLESLLKHASHYGRGICPIIPSVVGLAADVQKDAAYFPWVLAAFNSRGDCFVLDWGEAQDTDELETLRQRPIPVQLADTAANLERFPGGIVPPVFVTHAVIDSGHRAKGDEVDPTATTVYKFVQRAGMVRSGGSIRYKWVPMKGRGANQLDVLLKTSSATLSDTISLPLILFRDPDFKSELYHYQLAFDPTPGAPDSKTQTQARALPRILLPRYLPDATLEENQISYNAFLMELQAERYGTIMHKPRGGGPAQEIRRWYVPAGLRNNFGDCLKMLKVLHSALPKAAANAA